MKKTFFLILLIQSFYYCQSNEKLRSLAAEFWQWRTVQQPVSPDDIPRFDRPDGWTPDFSKTAIASYNDSYKNFLNKLDNLDKSKFSISDSVDYLCLRSAIERVNWELNILSSPFTNPDFYVTQTLGSIYELLTIHTPFDEQRLKNLIIRLNAFPKIISDAKENLSGAKAPFAKIAVDNLDNILTKMKKINEAVGKEMKVTDNHLNSAFDYAAKSLDDYREWLQKRLPGLKKSSPIGKEAYNFFLKKIALIPYSTDEILELGRLEFNRAVAFELLEKQKNIKLPKPEMFKSIEEEIEQGKKDEKQIRNFIQQNNLATIPEWLKHYYLMRTPERLLPIKYISVDDDLTSENRLTENAARYIPTPGPNLPFFYNATAFDPRPLIIHEGIPGHYFQLAVSSKNPDALRRRFVDSGPNEGIAFYMEEILLQAGLFDKNTSTKEIIYSFMRLRALRVEADVQLALGTFTTDQVAEFLSKAVPMDKQTAVDDASFYSYNPGQAISYQIGKIQVMKFLSDAKMKLGDKFDIKNFHDYLVLNGNVPISLLRWEYLGLRSEIKQFFIN